MSLPESVGGFAIGPYVGHGMFGTVFKGHQEANPSQIVAIKQVKLQYAQKKNVPVEKEINIMKCINHDNVVKFYNAVAFPDKLYVIMEWCNGGDLHDYITKARIKLPEQTIRLFFRQISSALYYFRDHNIMHRDLKPHNILLHVPSGRSLDVADDGEIVLKLADFGFARYLQGEDMAATMCGSPLYMAPEILLQVKYDGRADLWSVGAIMYQCYHNCTPFFANSPTELRKLYETSDMLEPMRGYAPTISAEFKDLLESLLQKNPEHRIAVDQFCSHPFLCPVIESREPGRPNWSLVSQSVPIPHGLSQTKSEESTHSSPRSFTNSQDSYDEHLFHPSSLDPPSLMRVRGHEPGPDVMEQSIENGYSLISQGPGRLSRHGRVDSTGSPSSSPQDANSFRPISAGSSGSPARPRSNSGHQRTSTMPRQISRGSVGAPMSRHGSVDQQHGSAGAAGYGSSPRHIQPGSDHSSPRFGNRFSRHSSFENSGSYGSGGRAGSRFMDDRAQASPQVYRASSSGPSTSPGASSSSPRLRHQDAYFAQQHQQQQPQHQRQQADRHHSGPWRHGGESATGRSPSGVTAAAGGGRGAETFSQYMMKEYSAISSTSETVFVLDRGRHRASAIMAIIDQRRQLLRRFLDAMGAEEHASNAVCVVEVYCLSKDLARYLEAYLAIAKTEIEREHLKLTQDARTAIKSLHQTYKVCVELTDALVKVVMTSSRRTDNPVSVEQVVFNFALDKLRSTVLLDMFGGKDTAVLCQGYALATNLFEYLLENCEPQFTKAAPADQRFALFHQSLRWLHSKSETFLLNHLPAHPTPG